MKNVDLTNKKILVVGLGSSGIATGRLALNKGASLWITEKADNQKTREIAGDFMQRGAVVELGKHSEEFVKEKDLIVISPGVAAQNENVIWAEKYKIPVVSELEFASWYMDCPLICVTGTNGKSTVTSLIDFILRRAGKKSIACGNLGWPLSDVVLNCKKLDFAVVEVSSFQLEFIRDFKPYISVWLNFSYDHLDHHASMDEYLRAKLRIFENQDNNDWAIIYFEEEERVGNIKTKKVIYGNDKKSELIVKDALLKGRHNQDNIQAAFLASKICGVENETIINAVLNFKPLAHRMEYVDKINDIIFIDDSKATNVHAVIPALHSLQCPVMLILGGRDKGDDFTRLEDTIREKVSGVVVIGEAKDKIIKQLNGIVPIYESATLEDAVKCSYKNAKNNTTVLLSPGCSSFDMFKDYKERGNRFKEAVRNLKIKTQNTNLKNTLLNAVIS